jgi:hypothetical protein
LPQASVADQVRVAEKVLPHSPLVTVLVIAMTTLVPPQPSVAVGRVKLNDVPHSTVALGAQVIVGAVVSTTVIFWLHRAVLPAPSVASQVRVTL